MSALANLTDDEHRALGLVGRTSTAPQAVAHRADDAAQGAGVKETLLALMASFAPTSHALAQEHGFALQTSPDPQTVLLVADDESPLTVRPLGGVESVVPDDDVSRVALRLERGAMASVERGDGSMLIVRGTDDGVEVAGVFVDLPPCAELRTLGLDPWSRGEVDRLLADQTPSSLAMAVGFAVRLALPADLRTEVQEHLAGDVPVRLAVGRAWVAVLTEVQRRMLKQRAVAVVGRLQALVADIANRDTSDDTSIRARAALVESLCTQREEIAWLEEVLAQGPIPTRLDDLLADLDANAGAVIFSLTRPRINRRVRILERASIGDPEAWWVKPLDDLP